MLYCLLLLFQIIDKVAILYHNLNEIYYPFLPVFITVEGFLDNLLRILDSQFSNLALSTLLTFCLLVDFLVGHCESV